MSAAPDHRRAYELLGAGDIPGALALTEPLAADPAAGVGVLAAHAAVLKAAGRPQEALAVNRRAAERFPQSGATWHNLAATLGDLALGAEAEAAARRALALGIAAPETRLVLARALQSQMRLDEAQEAFLAAIAARPDYAEAHRELAQLIWMRTGDGPSALARLAQAVAAYPANPGLAHALATAQEFTGEPEAARLTCEAGLARAPQAQALLALVVKLCGELDDPDAALAWAERSRGVVQPGLDDVLLAQARLAAGDAAGAAEAAERAAELMPTDQSVQALRATAWRMTGDPRYAEVADYDRLVGVYDLWAEDDPFLGELRAAIERLHAYAHHPFAQSVRAGAQATLRLDGGHEAPIEALLARLREAADRHAASVAPGADPFTSVGARAARMSGAWTIRLGASGSHANHVHALGWLSSVFYVAVPAESRDPEKKAGWLKFGQPGVATRPPLEPERYVAPRPGRLVLFPSYAWHGVTPIAADEPRITVAFDALPVRDQSAG